VGPVLELVGIQKSYRSLRPLRIQELIVMAGERVAISGLDAGAAEVLVNLVTGASLPDQGEVRVLGRPTSAIADGDAWLASLDRFGIVSPRAVLLEAVTIQQNIAMPFTLDIDPVPADVALRVSALAASCGISDVHRLAGDADSEVRARVHLARAIALEPAIVVLEHPTADLPQSGRDRFARDLVAALESAQLTALILTQDEDFAKMTGHRPLRLEPATGALKPPRRGWFG
jgi:ABC-type lipoprotein export system ATPase subunit